jgi:predicted phosphodiesterase
MKSYRPKIWYNSDAELQKYIEQVEIIKGAYPDRYVNKAKFQKWIVVSDVHRPFHNKVLWSKLLQLIKDFNNTLYGFVMAGDYLDLYTLGSYNTESLANLSGLTLQDEYIDGLEGMDDLNKVLKKHTKKVFLFGNHEDRYFRHIKEKDNAKYGGALLNPVEALYLHENNWEVKTDWMSDYFTIGEHLDVIHGIYTSVHSAKTHLDKTNHSVMFGHTHRVQCYHSGNKASYNIGGLYDIKSKGFNYMPRLQRETWANGFAIVTVNNEGEFYVEQVNVWNDCFLAEGKMY